MLDNFCESSESNQSNHSYEECKSGLDNETFEKVFEIGANI